jgi:hypothetical protein
MSEALMTCLGLRSGFLLEHPFAKYCYRPDTAVT